MVCQLRVSNSDSASTSAKEASKKEAKMVSTVGEQQMTSSLNKSKSLITKTSRRSIKSILIMGTLFSVLLAFSGHANAKVDGDTIILGAALSQSGKFAKFGKHTSRGYDFAVKTINAKGGVKVGGKSYKLKIIYYDDQSKPPMAAKLVEKLITKDGVQFILGPFSSGMTKAVASITEKHKIPMVEANGADKAIHSKGYKYTFGVMSTSDYYLKEAVNLAAQIAAKKGRKPSSLKVAVVAGTDPFSSAIRSGVLEDASKHGMKVVIDDKLPKELNDLSAILAKAKTSKPDLLIVTARAKGAALAVRQVKEQNIPIPMMAVTHCEAGKVIKKFGASANGTLCATQWESSLSYKDSHFGSASKYAKSFEGEYGSSPHYVSAESSAAVLIWADALQRAGSFDVEKVRNALAATDLKTFYGPVKYDGTGKNVAKRMVLRQIQDGKFIAVSPRKFASGKLHFPR